MCGRYYVDDDTAKEIQSLVQNVDERIGTGCLRRDIHPSDQGLVIAGNSGTLNLVMQKWGYPGFRTHSVIFNARSETVLHKRMFMKGIRFHRVIIPGTGFYEWNRNRDKITFMRKDLGALYMAGFSSWFEDGEHFVILTTRANASVSGTHDRMPLILEREEAADWILNDFMTEQFLGHTPVLLKKRAEYEQQSFL